MIIREYTIQHHCNDILRLDTVRFDGHRVKVYFLNFLSERIFPAKKISRQKNFSAKNDIFTAKNNIF